MILSYVMAAAGDLERGVVVHPETKDIFPELFNALRAELTALGPDIGRYIVHPEMYTDQTPKLDIPRVPQNSNLVIVPGFISGKYAERQLSALTKVGYTLRAVSPNDSRTPWVQHLHFLLTDFEGRGNKPTIRADSSLHPNPELQYAYYLADALRDSAKADSVTVLDPHDAESIRALREGADGQGRKIEVTTLTALGEEAKYMREHNLIPENSAVIIADNGAIGRSLFFAKKAELPITTRIVKLRRNGKPVIDTIYGGDDIRGKTAILVDDMIATGGTLFEDAKALMDLGAKEVIAVVTHIKGVKDADDNIFEKLQQKEKYGLTHIVATNSTPYHNQLEGITNTHIINILPLMARAAKAVLVPTDENIAAVSSDIFPINTVDEYLKWLYQGDPSLAPDYSPSADGSGRSQTVFTLPALSPA